METASRYRSEEEGDRMNKRRVLNAALQKTVHFGRERVDLSSLG
jgi:hypothetical protein